MSGFNGNTVTDSVEQPSAECDQRPDFGLEHCAHLTGYGSTDGMGRSGTSQVRCCYCGEYTDVRWTIETKRIPGHGPNVTTNEYMYEWPTGWRNGSPDSETEPEETETDG